MEKVARVYLFPILSHALTNLCHSLTLEGALDILIGRKCVIVYLMSSSLPCNKDLDYIIQSGLGYCKLTEPLLGNPGKQMYCHWVCPNVT